MRRLFYLFYIILFHSFLVTSLRAQSEDSTAALKPIVEPLPIFSYDSNIGFGYGVKSFFLNFLKSKESFDIILFNSTKGERWYRFVFSIPDFELRQGKKYPMAVDLTFDYDKLISSYFYGVGNQSSYDNKIKYTQELVELNLTASRGFSRKLVSQLAVSYKSIENSNIQDTPDLMNRYPQLIPSRVEYYSFILNMRYDSRNSFINPNKGIVLDGKIEFAPELSFNNVSFLHWTTWLQYYRQIFIKRVILAMRFGLQEVRGQSLPIQVLIPLGSNRTLRGYSLSRFLDKSAALFNAEIRFPIYWRFGGIIGMDTGRVWESIEKFNLDQWHSNVVLGLRFYLQTYIVRLDVGISHEITGLYLNFNHIF
jgi:outer membrane protein assembly factor BamA